MANIDWIYPVLIIVISVIGIAMVWKKIKSSEGFGLTRRDTYQPEIQSQALFPYYPQLAYNLPVNSLPADMGGLDGDSGPVDNFNSAPQLEAIQQAFGTGYYDNDSIGNLKLSSQHTNWINNMM